MNLEKLLTIKIGEKISTKGSRSRSVAARSKPTITVQAGGNILPGGAALGSSDQEQSAVSQAGLLYRG